MAFFPIVPTTDNRATKGVTPIVLRNCVIEPQPQGVEKRSAYYIAPSMGRVARVTPSTGKNIRGVFSRPGVLDGALFVAAGSQLYQISTSWAATALGPIQGVDDPVLFDNIGANLVLLAGSTIYKYSTADGLQVNTDEDCPRNAHTLAVLGDRALTNARGSDQFDWSATSDPLAWPSSGFASSARMPDEIRNQTVIGGDLWHFGANSAQVWRAMGGEDVDAFDIISLVVDRGIVGRDAIAKLDSSVMWVGDDRVIYMLNGYTPQRISNREIEQRLSVLSDTEAAALQCFSYWQGSHVYWVLRMPSDASYTYDALSQTWCEATTWETARYAPTFHTYFHAAGKHVVASDDDDAVFTWEDDTYSDNSLPHERIMMLHVPISERTIISNITLDLKCSDVPLVGQGSDPIANVTFYTDGGSRDSLSTRAVERPLRLGQRGAFDRRPTVWRLGMVNAADGMLIKVRITDPINFALSGVWINENPT
jgi:hypothetical protein